MTSSATQNLEVSFGPYPAERAGYLYCMTDDIEIKIGISRNIELRKMTVATARKRKVRVLFFRLVHRDDARSIEKIAHYILQDRATGNEWFRATPKLGAWAIDEAARCHDIGERVPAHERCETVAVGLSKDTLRRLDNWRARGCRIPSRAAAVRALLERALSDVERSGGRVPV